MTATQSESPAGLLLDGDADRHPDQSARLAALVFAAYLVVAFFVLVFVLGEYRWFLGDEYTFLSARNATDLGELVEPLNGHWTTLPILVFRSIYSVVGMHSYVPYQIVVILLHLTAAALLRVVMRRAGVGPWIATVAAGSFVLFGSGASNIIWAFQMTLVGSLVFGLVQLLLTDHDGPVDRRDWLALGAGLGSLLCSGLGLIMVAVVGIATLVRRGWRAALQTVPLGVVYVAWYFAVRPPAPESGQAYSPGETARKGADWLWSGASATFDSLGRSPFVGTALVLMLVVGLAVGFRSIGMTEARRRWAASGALLAGAALFLLLTLVTAADRGFWLGVDEVRSERYLHLTAALVLPALALAADALARRWTVLMPVVLLLFLVGVPGNIRAFDPPALFGEQYYDSQRALLVGIARSDLAEDAPPSIVPEPTFTPDLTVGWLRNAERQGRLPDAPELDPLTAATLPVRLGIEHLDEPIPESLECRTVTDHVDIEPPRGKKFGIDDGGVSIAVLGPGQVPSGAVGYDPAGSGRVLRIARDDLRLRLSPAIGSPSFTFCS